MTATPPEQTTAPLVPHSSAFWAGIAVIIIAASVACWFFPFLLIPLPAALLAGGLMVRQKRDRQFGTLMMVLGAVALVWLSIDVINSGPK